MESLTIYVKKKEQIDLLYQFLQHLDFVVMPSDVKPKAKNNTEYDFFQSAGLWQNREITHQEIRAKAWKKI